MAIAKINVVLVDDHPLLLSGIKHEISNVGTIKLVGMTHNSTELMEILDRIRIDVLVTDYAMPGGEYGDGMQLLSFLRRRYPDLKIIVFTAITNPAIANEMMRIGVRSVLNKIDDAGRLISAIHAVHTGAQYISPSYDLASRVMLRQNKEASSTGALDSLSKREAEVVRLYISGMSIDSIAAHLHRTKQTVSAQKMSALRKLGIERDAQLFQWAFEMGLGTQNADSPEAPARNPE
ncbi:response regulator transcription factor [Paraburkholderia sp. J12]|uniref:response regulator transcription factor n=1 Tax=Paraburkholderia sp. J12 TaxID=2805432 RepID=UPI002ABE7FA1|nr:response regulator transcription factor [Paraburkholderia sp. J12]